MRDKLRNGFRIILMLAMVCIISVSGTGITAEAASTSTSVKILSVGKSYTVSGYTKVTSGTKSVATVTKKSSKKYTVNAVKTGRTTLSCYNKNGKLVKKIYLLVTDSSSLKYDTSTLNLVKGKSQTTVATAPSGCSVKYSSSNKKIVTVNSKGKITAQKTGSAKITVKVMYKGKTIKTYKKTVKVLNYTYDTAALSMKAGDTKTVAASVANGYSAKYSSSDTSIATVNSSGKITAMKAGTAKITVKIYKGKSLKKTYTKTVTVTAVKTTVSQTTKQTETAQTEMAKQTETAQTEATKQTEAAQTETTKQTESETTKQTENAKQTESETTKQTETAKQTETTQTETETTAQSEETEAPLVITGIPTDTKFVVGDTITLGYSADGISGVTWSSSDISIATVNNGTVICLKEGTVTISCKAKDGSCGSDVTIVIYSGDTETLPDEWS